MKTLLSLFFALTLLLSKAQQIELVTDVNTNFASPHNLVSVGEDIYFFSEQYGISHVLKTDSSFRDFTVVWTKKPGKTAALGGDLLIFDDPDDSDDNNVTQLWRSDGTASGTHLVKNVFPYYSTTPKELTKVDGRLFFTFPSELWVTDGTEVGTYLMQGMSSSYPTHLTEVNGKLFFSATDPQHGRELWMSDGTDSGTYMVKDINISNNSSPDELVSCNDKLFFVANNGSTSTSNDELWTSDGTDSGTYMVKEIRGFGGSDPRQLTTVNDQVFFVADDGTHGDELWITNGTESGTYMIKDINPSGSSWPRSLTKVGDKVFFFRDILLTGSLNISDGTDAGTHELKSGFMYFDNPTEFKDKLLFSAFDSTNGTGLWISDGTPNGTQLLKTLVPEYQSPADEFTVIGDKLFFTVTLPSPTSTFSELWETDGTTSGTKKVQHNTHSSGVDMDYLDPEWLVTESGLLFFHRREEVGLGNGIAFEVWASNGTATGTNLLLDSIRGYSFTEFKDKVFFNAGYAFYESDGTSEGTKIVKDDFILTFITTVNELFFGRARGASGEDVVWVSDGTAAGTREIPANYYFLGGNPSGLIAFKGRLYYSARDKSGDYKLWASDGTEAGTGVFFDMHLTGIAAGDNILFLRKNDELWVSDGTETGTREIENAFPYSNGTQPAVMNDKLFYIGNDNSNPPNIELWVSDGTEAGTQQVKDINPNGYSDPTHLNPSHGKLFFTADDGVNGRELWVSDGTENGTLSLERPANVIEVKTCGAHTYITNSVSKGVPSKLLETDGSKAGTRDIELNNIFIHTLLGCMNGKLLMVANDGHTGSELYKLDVATGIVEPMALEYQGIYAYENEIFIKPNETVDDIEVYTISGQLLFTASAKEKSSIQLPPQIKGLVIINYHNQNGWRSLKHIVE